MPTEKKTSTTLRWNLSIWFAIALFSATQTVFVMRAEGMHHAWTALYITQVLDWLPWLLVTPLVLRLGQRMPIEHPSWVAVISHLLTCATIDVISSAWTGLLEEVFNPWANAASAGPFVPLWIDHVYNRLLQSLFLYAAILAVGYIVRSRERLARQQIDAAELREALTQAQLDALRRQIAPHFLFNALNSAVALVRERRADDAVSTLIALSDVLRRVMETSDRQEIALGEELQFLRKYLEIQKVRFADRLRVDIHVADELLAARVPSLVLQPIVENAIKHGIAARAGEGCVQLDAARKNGSLDITIYNDGPDLKANGAPGIGLANVRSRLECLYGKAFSLDLRNARQGVEAALSIPYREH
jgi:hypothetical protein